MKNTKLILGSLLALFITSCEYSNTFTGQFNGTPATLSAYSKNINRYCVAINLTSGTETHKGYISAQLLFDADDFMRAKSFNSKGSGCNSNMSEYLVGVRSVDVKQISEVSSNDQIGGNRCQVVYYKQYTYQEKIDFEYRDNATDLSKGSFSGIGGYETYTDFSRPVRYGRIYFCGPSYPPFPGPYPGPYPRPYPRSFPGGPFPW